MRGIADDVPLKPWLTEHIWPREGRFVSPEFVYDGTLLACAEMLRGGITACNDMYFYPDDAARAYEEAGMRALVGMPILDFPTAYAADADAYLARGLDARDAWKHVPHARVRAGAARAVHGRRRDVREDRHVRAPARPADRDPSRRDAGRSRRRARRNGHDDARPPRHARRDGPELHRDPRRARGRTTTSRCSCATAATSCIARRRT